jgi:SAM-dependent methyltransferase
MKAVLLELLRCPTCSGRYCLELNRLVCSNCQAEIPLQNEIPLFSDVPPDITPSEKRPRGAGMDTPWRSANTRFLEGEAQRLPGNAIVLDVGAGRGDFSSMFTDQRYLAVEIYPYPEVDIVCDLTKVNPFAPGSLDVILLMNVLEHLQDAAEFIKTLSGLLRPGGKILAAVPFLVKIHQAPYDFARYTHYHLQKMGEDAGLRIDRMEGYYDPAFLIGESERYARFWGLPRYPAVRRRMLAVMLAGLRLYQGILSRLLGAGYLADAAKENNPAPVGYHVIYRKAERSQ